MYNPYYSFADSVPHTHLVGTLYYKYMSQFDDDDLFKTHSPFKDNVALVFGGHRRASASAFLFDASEFTDFPLSKLSTIEPDFMFFRENKFLINQKQTRVLGQPDLVVEIWSPSNDETERSFKYDLYSSSPVTEHWYISLEDDEVFCYYGEEQLESQNLNKPLVTRKNISLDLTRFAKT